jgi:hypothetical protein
MEAGSPCKAIALTQDCRKVVVENQTGVVTGDAARRETEAKALKRRLKHFFAA